MIWNKKEDTVTVKLNGQTFHFKADAETEVKKEGISIKRYEQSFQEKQRSEFKKMEKKKQGHSKTSKFPPNATLTKEEMIQEMFDMSMDDLALKLNTLQREREKNALMIRNYAKSEEAIKDFLEQMVKKELYLNKEVAEPLLMKFEVHPENKQYQRKYPNPKEMVEALFYIQHCHRADILDMMEEVRKAKQDNRSLGLNLEEMHKRQTQQEEEHQQEKEKTQKKFAEIKEKYVALQEELKRKTNENKQLKQQNVDLQEKVNELEEALKAKSVEQSITPIIEEIAEVELDELLEDIGIETPLKELEEIAIPEDAFLEEELEQELEQELEEKLEEMPPPKEEVVVVETKEEKEKSDEKLNEKTNKENSLLETFNFDFMDEDSSENSSENTSTTVQEEMPYVSILKEKGYEVEPAPNHQYDLMVAKDTNEKAPLMYIYYDIEKAEEFDSLMKDTNKMYFVFDSKKRMFKGNTKFTSWLLKQKERKFDIQFSFTTVEQLKASGLNVLDKI